MQRGTNSSSGHRQRLRAKFLLNGLNGFLDYEIIELLLTLGTPRRDCKQLAKDAITKFGSLQKILDASSDELQQIPGLGPSNIVGILLFQSLQERYTKAHLASKKSLNSPLEISNYIREKIGKKNQEHFIILFFNTRNELIYSDVSLGTINASLVHPREVFHSAILQHASHIIVAHNHPSGDPTPSAEDITTTKRLVDAGKLIGITIVDHIITTPNSYSSFKNLGLIAG